VTINHIAILYPSGNTTALVFDDIPIKLYREVNDFILEVEPAVEVVMFVNLLGTRPLGVMAGGEFCINATRSFGYYLMEGKSGLIDVNVGVVDKPLTVNIQNNKSKVIINTPDFLKSVELIDDSVAIVKLNGISHLIIDSSSIKTQEFLNTEDIYIRKKIATNLLYEYHLNDELTCGVMVVSNNGTEKRIFPYVHSKLLDDWYAETACGSGSLATAIAQAKRDNKSVEQLVLQQPSGSDLTIKVALSNYSFFESSVEGDVELLYEGGFSRNFQSKVRHKRINNVHKFSQ